jgi:DNA-binding MarR family transcriptional regulator
VSRSVRQEAQEIARLLPRLMRQLFALEAGDPTSRLSVAQVRVCTALVAGPQAMSAIGRELGISLSALTQIADRLEAAGIAQRVPASHDRRVRLLQLTPRGARAMELRNERRVARVREVIAPLSAAGRADVLGALQALEDAASAAVERERKRRNARPV